MTMRRTAIVVAIFFLGGLLLIYTQRTSVVGTFQAAGPDIGQ